ncbi:MAG: PEP-CTERM sorting domain-containing protein, partial [Gemmatimonadota bacterium]|nr:PEP-CTERM sorting domain-containing protein [Gemmatimonadota bacterium]
TDTFDEFLGYSGYSETLNMVHFDPTSCACRFFSSKLPPSVMITQGYDVVSGPSPVFDEGFVQLWSAGQQSVTTIRLDWLSVTDSQVASVPEPSTYALLAAGLAGLRVVARRRRLLDAVVS